MSSSSVAKPKSQKAAKASGTSKAPKGRTILAQGNALGPTSSQDRSPEGAIHERDLPAGWRWVTLREIAQISGGVTKGQKRRPSESVRKVPYLRVANVQRGYLDLSEVKEIEASAREIEALRLQTGDILFNEGGDRDKLGRGWVWNGELPECVHQNHVFRARLIDPENSPKFISFYGNSEGRRYFMAQGKQTTNLASINLTKLGQLPIPLPPPDQQRRIVAEIEKQLTRLDAGVEALRRVQANLKRYRAAVLKTACEGRLVPTEAELARAESRSFEAGEELLARILSDRRQRRSKRAEPTELDSVEVPSLPTGWTWATLDQIGQENRPIIYGIIKPGPHVADGVPYVRVTEMKDGTIDVPNLKRASPERAAKFARATLASGDVLISKDGTIGRVAVVPPELAGGNITQHVMRAPIHPMMLREYVVWAIRADWCQHWLTGETRGVALRGVNVEDFRRLPIPVPPLSEQTRIVAEVERHSSVVAELETAVTANLQRARRMRESILQKAFTGEFTKSNAL